MMGKSKNRKEKKAKLPFGISDEFVAELEAASVDDMKARIVTMQGGIDEAQGFLKDNQDVLDLKAAYDEAAGPTRDAIKALRNKTKMIVDALKKQGAL
jgi:hypothetical protein